MVKKPKFRSPIVQSQPLTVELHELEGIHSKLVLYSKIKDSENHKNLMDLVEKWRSASITLLSDLRNLIGHVQVQDDLRSLNLLEVSNSLKFDIKILGDYDECNDEFIL